MLDQKNDLKVERALVSVFDKTGLVEFGTVLKNLGVEIVATGGTRTALEAAGVTTVPLEEIGHFPEMLDGRVKTLQPEIFAGILARKPSQEHMKQISSLGVKPFDMIVCNFYAFEAAAERNSTNEELVEMIDIGGPSLVRASAKNFESVCVVPSSGLYPEVTAELGSSGGKISFESRKKFALKAFEIVSAYDNAIFNTLTRRMFPAKSFPDSFFLSSREFEVPKYGENPGQKAMIYSINGTKGGIPEWKQIFGDTRSYNNHLDIASSFEILEGFEETPAAATVKHGQISGFAFSTSLADAYKLAHACDPEADFGNTTVFNREVDVETAKLVGKNEEDDGSVYTEIVLAPAYEKDALEILKAKQKKKMRLIQTSSGTSYPYDVKIVQGLTLVQDSPDYRKKLDPSQVTVETKRAKPSAKDTSVLMGLWEVSRRVESNAIVIGNGEFSDGILSKLWTLGIGSFRKRNGATKIALDNAGKRSQGAYCASDGFFPFPDSVELLGRSGVRAIVQPGGSINDKKVVETSDRYSMPMLFTHERAFKH